MQFETAPVSYVTISLVNVRGGGKGFYLRVFLKKAYKYVILMIKDLRDKMIYYRGWRDGSVAK